MLNPVRARLVERAIDYQRSSAALHAGETASNPLVVHHDLLGTLPDARSWRQWMQTDGEVVRSQEDWLRGITRTGRPCGEPEFVAHAQRIAGRALAPKKSGPVARKASTERS